MGKCGATPSAVSGVTCIRDAGHAGAHRGSAGHKWLSPKPEALEKCPHCLQTKAKCRASGCGQRRKPEPEACHCGSTEHAACDTPLPGAHLRPAEQREDSDRLLNAALAVVRLDDAIKSAGEARACLLFVGLAASHPAIAAAGRAEAEARKAAAVAKEVVRTLKRMAEVQS